MNKRQNLLVILTCFLFVLSSFSISTGADSIPAGADTVEPDEYPNGWTHRPIMEQFTSLGCPPCMGIDPDVAKLWKEFREEPGQPVTFVSFHQINGGSDDEFAS